jgi:hypothetical protein
VDASRRTKWGGNVCAFGQGRSWVEEANSCLRAQLCGQVLSGVQRLCRARDVTPLPAVCSTCKHRLRQQQLLGTSSASDSVIPGKVNKSATRCILLLYVRCCRCNCSCWRAAGSGKTYQMGGAASLQRESNSSSNNSAAVLPQACAQLLDYIAGARQVYDVQLKVGRTRSGGVGQAQAADRALRQCCSAATGSCWAMQQGQGRYNRSVVQPVVCFSPCVACGAHAPPKATHRLEHNTGHTTGWVCVGGGYDVRLGGDELQVDMSATSTVALPTIGEYLLAVTVVVMKGGAAAAAVMAMEGVTAAFAKITGCFCAMFSSRMAVNSAAVLPQACAHLLDCVAGARQVFVQLKVCSSLCVAVAAAHVCPGGPPFWGGG